MAFRLALVCSVIYVCSASGSFQADEYKGRLERVQAMMRREGFGALFLTMEAHHKYFGGIKTEFFESPTRPYYLVIPAQGLMTAVVPGLILPLYEASPTVGRTLSWSAPQPEDDGISLLVGVLEDLRRNLPDKLVIGAELGPELDQRMPAADFGRLKKVLRARADFKDASMILKRLRVIKSAAEVALVKEACRVNSIGLNNIPNIVKVGMTEREISRLARIELLKNGADRVDYIACRSGAGGYTDIVGAASERRLQEGDVLIIDAGTVVDDYFCDFNRNWYVGISLPREIEETQEALYNVLEAGIRAALPGRGTEDIYNAMVAKMPSAPGNVGRMGHGVGQVITEWPSIMAGVNVTLEEGMVFALEPGLAFGEGGRFLVHEDDVVIRKGGAELLSSRGPRKMPLIKPEQADDDVLYS
jgi:Xaa-Pro aminopeptidase